MERRVPQLAMAAISVVACAGVTVHRINDFGLTSPPKDVFANAPAYYGGTLMTRGAYHSAPPNGKVEVTAVRRFMGGAAIPDS